jgi:sortase A
MKSKDIQTLIEQAALLIASFIWTTIVLTGFAFFWAYQDVQARWEYVLNAPPEALAQAVPQVTPTPSPTVWAGPGPTLTPTPTLPPSPTPTRVVPLPDLLPETLNPDEPTPIPVIVHTADEAIEFGVELEQSAPTTIGVLPTPNPAAESATTQQATQPTQNTAPAVAEQPASVSAAAPRPLLTEGEPTRLVIPSIGIDAAVIPVGWNVIERNGQQFSIWQVADFAVGWHKTTPALGQVGNTVMAGHHNVNGEVFRDLVNLEVGDKVFAYSEGEMREYEVELKTIIKEKGEPPEVRRRNAQWISPTDDERLTFVTCWPYTNNTHRVIVVAKPTT